MATSIQTNPRSSHMYSRYFLSPQLSCVLVGFPLFDLLSTISFLKNSKDLYRSMYDRRLSSWSFSVLTKKLCLWRLTWILCIGNLYPTVFKSKKKTSQAAYSKNYHSNFFFLTPHIRYTHKISWSKYCGFDVYFASSCKVPFELIPIPVQQDISYFV